MPIVTLPDGSQKSFEKPISVQEVAMSIGKGLANAALAGKVNGKLVDTSYIIEEDVQLSIVTEKDKEGLEVLRHSCAHLLAHAVQSVYPQAQVTIGPVIEDGFYYDFAFGRPFTPEDLALFEEKMADIAKQDLPVSRHVISRADAIEKFKKMGEHYKVQIIQDIPETEMLTFYQEGDFVDLCRGPHVPSTSKIKAFKLLKVAGAYWRGDSKNEMLQRIYGTAWTNKKDLDAYLFRLEEAEKRDHRKLGKKYDLFHMQEEAPGMVFWHPKGWVVYQQIVSYVRNLIGQHGYQEVNTPQVVDRSLWERSGHWQMFHANMFTVQSDEKVFAVKPMNCPCHVQIYNHGIKSYRDLPIRLAEFGSCHRNEPSGALHGIMRTRNFVQDDAHIFCTEDQIQSEVSAFIDLLFKVYGDFGFNDILIKLSTRPEQRVGSDEIWDKAEKALEDSLNAKQLPWELHPGEGAFYGPKIEFSLRDCMGRVWQCGTVQIDFSMPVRLEAEYVAEDGSRHTPVMVHRAILGSLERFIGILIEEHAGNFPTWLAPIQVVVMNITQNQAEYAEKITQELKTKGIRAVTDLRNEKIGFKIREHTVQRVPYLVVLGDREVNQQTITVRTRTGEDLGSMALSEFEYKLNSECQTKAVK
ncbi:MAG: threonine--tRNA ligase [Gammaproteobacteria bacterium]|jgi:threonyl-tRNA synthetase|nr:threonine--tRNA ligase [Gammaproteobacteria bacterium]